MNKEEYIDAAKREFAHYGFVATPLTDEQLASLYEAGASLETVYGIGCDVHCGYRFEDCRALNS